MNKNQKMLVWVIAILISVILFASQLRINTANPPGDNSLLLHKEQKTSTVLGGITIKTGFFNYTYIENIYVGLVFPAIILGGLGFFTLSDKWKKSS